MKYPIVIIVCVESPDASPVLVHREVQYIMIEGGYTAAKRAIQWGLNYQQTIAMCSTTDEIIKLLAYTEHGVKVINKTSGYLEC